MNRTLPVCAAVLIALAAPTGTVAAQQSTSASPLEVFAALYAQGKDPQSDRALDVAVREAERARR